ncbi:cell division protein FtsX [Rhizorhapis sp. SPR117]|uniref:cell division protein FtsX n=1 Tax=Rhizorhapis sp. SPR117 TaxID=2912611 RepID=UPI001F400B42|nr:cell division protein [Rhizorhapis sp. SPR117]
MAGRNRNRRDRATHRRLLPEGRLSGTMPWVIAIMMFLTILAAAAGIGLDRASRSLHAELAGRVTIQIIEADPEIRADQTGRVMTDLRRFSGVSHITLVDEADMKAALRPWLGEEMMDSGLPIPALIDVDLKPGVDARAYAAFRDSVTAIAPTARVEPHAAFLTPLSQLMRMLKWLALALVLLMTLATAAIVVLAAQAAHNSHRTTIEVLHLMGATDVQIARLFQRRMAFDALFGGVVGLVAASLVLALVAVLIRDIGSDLLGAAALPNYGWGVLLLLPLGGVLLAMLTARTTVLRALRRSL